MLEENKDKTKISIKTKIRIIILIVIVFIIASCSGLCWYVKVFVIDPNKRLVDYNTAKKIRTAIATYRCESEDMTLEKALNNNISYEAMINTLKHEFKGYDSYTGDMVTYGPYLDESENYDTLWNPSRGGHYVGFEVLIDSLNVLRVRPIELRKGTYSKEESEGRAHKLIIRPEIYPYSKIESILEGWELLNSNAKSFVKGDLNNDDIEDCAFVIQKAESEDKAPPRELIITTEDKDYGFYIVVRAPNALLRKDEGGTMGDPFSGISIEDDSLIISFYGGSAWRWSKEASFKFIDDGWYLTKLISENFHATSKQSSKTIRNYLTGEVTEIETDEKGTEKQTKSKIDEQELINIVDFDIRQF